MATTEKHLLQLFSQLAAGDQATLLAFAEFLCGRSSPGAVVASSKPQEIPEPGQIERPAEESIVGCLKRLAKTYPMLDKNEMLKATSELVATNIMKGGDTVEVIDELERIFRTHYEQLRAGT
ncbi:MAG: Crp/Fnr family transcriptional regulator [Gammaproteobacteria bacterium]|nr:Crp/Fnr family transcriptional regulator [Gammaproteobacteria bacterium]